MLIKHSHCGIKYIIHTSINILKLLHKWSLPVKFCVMHLKFLCAKYENQQQKYLKFIISKVILGN